MLNLNLGLPETIDGRSCLRTLPGPFGHAVYGPYEQLNAGEYLAGFRISSDEPALPEKVLLAVIDVSCAGGKQLLARREVRSTDLADGSAFTVPFTAAGPCRAEYRVWVSGKASLLIEDNRSAVPVMRSTDGAVTLSDDAHFPEEAGASVPFFVENRQFLRNLYDQGIAIRIVDGGVRAVVGGIVLHGRSLDDLRFVGELFFENAYNFGVDRQTAVFDVGMNVGLAALHFARKAEVAEVHAFEPFPETFERAIANIALNPALSAKIKPHHVGLSDRDFDGPILINDKDDSGAMTTVGVEGGVAVQLSLRDAGPLLAPLIEDAIGRGLEVILKVDCEGSEFAVFESLQRNGLLGKIRAFLVEWHSMFDGKTQETLLAPLRQAGFLVFDRSPPVGNGFFYAVRIVE
ncbi:FkbM family methyltransferase [Sphingomonas sp. BIUV-7]|uniref:FkbM family methyltransferase n=1 Tax=Sphingomonas natans TaxID=3063330 RepID=A0ABT8Y5T6_9SPHN|nr:FkbM family methyltransferase [Sphingomonas sp. BIUV-7]MDO6413686.1 FkbM family methyltransferase [Sphingomonas sp. BIUV-7]